MDLLSIERDRVGQQLAASLVAALVLTGALAAVVGGAAAQSSDPAIVLEANEDATAVDLTLTEAPNGLAGFQITLEVSGDSEANITGASYGDKFGLTESPEIDNGNEVRLKTSDVSDNVQPGATDVHLATVELEGAQKDTELLTATSLTVDDDDGGRVNPSVRWASHSHEDPPSNDDNEESNNNNQESNNNNQESNDNDNSNNDNDSDDSSSGDSSSDESGGSDDATDSSTTEASTDDDTEEPGDSATTESDESAGPVDTTAAPSTESEGTESTSSDAGGEQSTTAESGDGFGVLPAVVGVLSLALYVRRTR